MNAQEHRHDPAQAGGCAHSHTHTHPHEHAHQKAVLNRLSRAIGHLESVKKMVERGEDCADVLIQLAAVRAALNSTGSIANGLVNMHLKGRELFTYIDSLASLRLEDGEERLRKVFQRERSVLSVILPH